MNPPMESVCPWLSPAQARVVEVCIATMLPRLSPDDRRLASIALRSVAVARLGYDVKNVKCAAAGSIGGSRDDAPATGQPRATHSAGQGEDDDA